MLKKAQAPRLGTWKKLDYLQAPILKSYKSKKILVPADILLSAAVLFFGRSSKQIIV